MGLLSRNLPATSESAGRKTRTNESSCLLSWMHVSNSRIYIHNYSVLIVPSFSSILNFLVLIFRSFRWSETLYSILPDPAIFFYHSTSWLLIKDQASFTYRVQNLGSFYRTGQNTAAPLFVSYSTRWNKFFKFNDYGSSQFRMELSNARFTSTLRKIPVGSIVSVSSYFITCKCRTRFSLDKNLLAKKGFRMIVFRNSSLTLHWSLFHAVFFFFF